MPSNPLLIFFHIYTMNVEDGTLVLRKLVALSTAVTEATCQGEGGVFQLGKSGSHPPYHSPAHELSGILFQGLPV